MVTTNNKIIMILRGSLSGKGRNLAFIYYKEHIHVRIINRTPQHTSRIILHQTNFECTQNRLYLKLKARLFKKVLCV